MDFCTGDREHIDYLYRDPFFNKCLEDLRAKGGECLVAARKADEFIDILLHQNRRGDRKKFRFTRNGEARIRNCKKVDLGCGYRIVCIKKDAHLALIYMGTHDDCFRWIERNRGMKYDLVVLKGIRIDHEGREVRINKDHAGNEEEKMFREYEEILMSRLSDEVLRRVFSGLCQKPAGDKARHEHDEPASMTLSQKGGRGHEIRCAEPDQDKGNVGQKGGRDVAHQVQRFHAERHGIGHNH